MAREISAALMQAQVGDRQPQGLLQNHYVLAREEETGGRWSPAGTIPAVPWHWAHSRWHGAWGGLAFNCRCETEVPGALVGWRARGVSEGLSCCKLTCRGVSRIGQKELDTPRGAPATNPLLLSARRRWDTRAQTQITWLVVPQAGSSVPERMLEEACGSST